MKVQTLNSHELIMRQRTIIIRFTVKPKVRAVCNGGGGAGPMVPIQPIQPINKRIPVPTISAANIVIVFSCIFHITSVKIAYVDVHLDPIEKKETLTPIVLHSEIM